MDKNDRFTEVIQSGLNNCLSIEANIDQSGRAFVQDIVMSMFDEGCVAILPIDTDGEPRDSGNFRIYTMRTARILDWYPEHVRLEAYCQEEGRRREVIVKLELRAVRDDTVLKSAIFYGRILPSLNGQKDAPGNPLSDALNRLESTIANAQTLADEIRQKLDNGEFIGERGPQGEPGKDGSDANVTAENIQSALGYAPVRDVQVAGSSVLVDGVANAPIASETNYGVVKVFDWGGTRIDENKRLCVFQSSTNHIAKRESRTVIVPENLDYAVKAAMCDGKGAAWTDAEQKAARERMGVDKAYELIEEITLAEESRVVRSTEPDGTPYNFAVIMLRAEFPASEKTGNIYASYDVGNNPASVVSYFISPYKADAVKYGYSKAWVENSRYRSGWWTCVENKGQFAQYYENPVLQDKYSIADGNIIGFSTDVMVAGTKITIYGVRA